MQSSYIIIFSKKFAGAVLDLCSDPKRYNLCQRFLHQQQKTVQNTVYSYYISQNNTVYSYYTVYILYIILYIAIILAIWVHGAVKTIRTLSILSQLSNMCHF